MEINVGMDAGMRWAGEMIGIHIIYGLGEWKRVVVLFFLSVKYHGMG